MLLHRKPTPYALLILIPALYLGALIIGVMRWYTPVPWRDMWDGFIRFHFRYIGADGGVPHDWQMGEHLIVLTKLLFVLDMDMFGGRFVFLTALNVVLAALMWLCLCAALRRLFADRELWLCACAATAALQLSWMQRDNLVWAFQSQFFLVYLLPLAAFICLGMSYGPRHARIWFTGALILGVMSCGAMANGLAVIPLMIVMTFLMGKPFGVRVATLSVAGAAVFALWIAHYVPQPLHPAPLAASLAFFLAFLSAPVANLLPLSHMSAALVSGAFVLACGILAVGWGRQQPRHSMVLALLAMLAYIGASATAISLGRALRDSPLATRYTTPTLLGWSLILALAIYAFRDRRWLKPAVAFTACALALAMWQVQARVQDDEGPELAQRMMFAVLSLKLGLNEIDALQYIYPVANPDQPGAIIEIGGRAAQARLGIFGDERLESALGRIGTLPSGLQPCAGALDIRRPVPAREAFERATGWAYNTAQAKVPAYVYLVADGMVVGVGVTGLPRRDVEGALQARAARYSGYDAYLRSTSGVVSVWCQ